MAGLILYNTKPIKKLCFETLLLQSQNQICIFELKKLNPWSVFVDALFTLKRFFQPGTSIRYFYNLGVPLF